MAVIKPFRGVLYEQSIVGDLAAVTAPPYDVISEERTRELHALHDKNIIRLLLGKSAQGMSADFELYRKASQYFDEWQREGVLVQSSKPAIYVYSQRYTLTDGSTRERFGYIARLKLEDFENGVVMPHEFTFKGPRLDRLNLMRACRANFDQIFCVYPDPEREIDAILESVTESEKETIHVEDETGIINRLWVIEDKSTLESIVNKMADKKALMADGHHRYEAALAYRDEMREKSGGADSAAEFVMIYFVNLYAPGLSVLPYHRVLKGLPDLRPLTLHNSLSDKFMLEEVKPLSGESPPQTLKRLLEHDMVIKGKEGKAFGVFGKSFGFWLLSSKVEEIAQEDLPIVEHLLGELDVSILHRQVIIPILGTDSQKTGETGGISYTSDPYAALKMVERGEGDAAFFLNPADLDGIMSIAEAGGRMPQKSTYFYPKPISGMVINKMDA